MSAKSPTFSKIHKKSQSTHSKPCPPPPIFNSASTFLYGIQSISFPKAPRLDLQVSSIQQSPCSIITSPLSFSFKNKRSTSFGYGQKQCLPPTVLKNARDFPGANAYKIPSDFDILMKGKTFGMPRKCYEKTSLPGIEKIPLGIAKELPGPGQYNLERKLKGGFSIVGKGNGFNKGNEDKGPLRIYQPNMEIVESGRFKNIVFGSGKRGAFNESKSVGPGPGSYELVGIFAKYNKKNKYLY